MPGPRVRARCAPLLLAPSMLLGACRAIDPPTVTPSAPQSAGATTFEMTVPAPAPAQLAPVPVTIGASALFDDPGGLFKIEVPDGWTESRQPLDPDKNPFLKVGTVFLAPGGGDALLSVTQWDSGRKPSGLGVTINQVLREVTGWMDQPGYREVNRETVMERKGEALRIEIQYTRSSGVPMHSLALFQIDGTTFSMVNVSVEEGSWAADDGRVREILRTYVPNAAAPPPPGAAAAASAAAPTAAAP
ncbi:MAG: hypothetical protein ABI780_00440 [Ardenticatenales bacterium]